MKHEFTKREVAAALAGCTEQEILKYRETEDGGAVVIKKNGQKLIYTQEQIFEQAEHMIMIATADAARELQIEIDNILDASKKLPVEGNTLPKEENKLPIKHKSVAGTATKKSKVKK